MKFLLDANVRYSIGVLLQSLGHDVRCIAGTTDRGLSDRLVLDIAERDGRILITNDKDFGDLIFRQRLPHHGVILLRLNDESRTSYEKQLHAILIMYGQRLEDHFIVVTEKHTRFRG